MLDWTTATNNRRFRRHINQQRNEAFSPSLDPTASTHQKSVLRPLLRRACPVFYQAGRGGKVARGRSLGRCYHRSWIGHRLRLRCKSKRYSFELERRVLISPMWAGVFASFDEGRYTEAFCLEEAVTTFHFMRHDGLDGTETLLWSFVLRWWASFKERSPGRRRWFWPSLRIRVRN